MRPTPHALTSLALLLPAAAFATDLNAHVEAWSVTRVGQDGSDGHDEAFGVALTSANGVVAAGQLDGAAQHGHDAFVVELAPDTSVRWEETTDSGAVGADRVVSEDRWNAVAVDPVNDNLVLCGLRAASVVTDPYAWYQVDGRLAGTPPTPDWLLHYKDGSQSPIQECRGVTVTNGLTWSAGWAQHGTDAGRWIGFALDSNGAITQTVNYDHLAFDAVPDEAHAVAVHTTSGEVTIVGERGVAGTQGSQRNDSDWHVRHFDTTGQLLWEATSAGSAGLMDRATAVAVDTGSGDAVVAGWVNKGTDNAGNADLDWQIVRYARLGDGAGGPTVEWTTTYESAPGASEGATGVAFDDVGDVLVSGWAIDAGSGKEVWRVGKYNLSDGQPRQEWLGPVAGGNARANAIAYRGDLVALAGFVETTAGDADFAVTLLDVDTDHDGTADSVDACPDDPAKAADGGVCGCGVPDDDTDGDGVENCLEDCPSDPYKTDPGICGCNDPDVDSDGDGTYDCNDHCPDDPNKTENDLNTGGCGCGAPNDDTDDDGVLGCHDACANTPPGTDVDEFGCPPSTTTPTDTGGTSTTDAGSDKGGGGCGCSTPSTPSSLLFAAPLLLVGARRRRV